MHFNQPLVAMEYALDSFTAALWRLVREGTCAAAPVKSPLPSAGSRGLWLPSKHDWALRVESTEEDRTKAKMTVFEVLD